MCLGCLCLLPLCICIIIACDFETALKLKILILTMKNPRDGAHCLADFYGKLLIIATLCYFTCQY